MSDLAIRVEGLGKLYRIGVAQPRYKTIRESLMNSLTAPFRRLRTTDNKTTDNRTTDYKTTGSSPVVSSPVVSSQSPGGPVVSSPVSGSPVVSSPLSRSPMMSRQSSRSPNEYIWALKDVSFEVNHGEVVGIIGRNGAGKSTLLKILSRITEPTEGSVNIRGRVGSLLEVGAGFHPELTGRENIYLNGAILGMKKTEIEHKFDEIVAFSEVERFMDTPIKHYSSGMYVRLAFAVAAHLEPEILLVDEVLAVGDAGFQKKCLGKMNDVAKEGRTVLFVSHNMGAITRLCGRALLLDQGGIALDDHPRMAANKYQSSYLASSAEWMSSELSRPDADFAFLRVIAKDGEGRSTSLFGGDESISVEISYVVQRPLSGCQIGARIYSPDGLVAFSTADADQFGVSALPKEPGSYRACFTIPGGFLAPGTYSLLVAAHLPYRHTYEVVEQTVVFDVSPSGSLASLDGRLGLVTPLIPWRTRREPL
jgi:lipopolysaccharide transport system ATP-binding protein